MVLKFIFFFRNLNCINNFYFNNLVYIKNDILKKEKKNENIYIFSFHFIIFFIKFIFHNAILYRKNIR